MKQYFYKALLIGGLSGSLLTSCDNWLDIVPKGNEILTTAEQYARLQNNQAYQIYNPSPFCILADDVWMNPLIINQPINGNNIIYTYKNPETVEPTRRFGGFYTTSGMYASCYERINKIANLTIDYIKDATGEPAFKEQTMAEAYALRAYNYFLLVNMYAPAYNAATAATTLAVPLQDKFNLEQTPRQGTVAEVYKLIEEDLDKAIPHLSNSPVVFHFSKAAAYALKAKAHLCKKEFEEAEKAAMESYKLNHDVFDLTTYTGAEAIKADLVKENLLYIYGSSVTGMGTSGFGGISQKLDTLFRTTCGSTLANVKDVRYKGFISFNSTTPVGNKLTGDQEFIPGYDSALPIAKNFPYNMTGIRTTEVILILAECCARKSDFEGAKKYLDEVRKKRIIGYTSATDMTNDRVKAVKLVIDERRKEFINGFNRVIDLKRLNTENEFKTTQERIAPAKKDHPSVTQKTYTLAPDSWLWVMPLPESEFELIPDLQWNVPY